MKRSRESKSVVDRLPITASAALFSAMVADDRTMSVGVARDTATLPTLSVIAAFAGTVIARTGTMTFDCVGNSVLEDV